jgi:hypothetical protein
MCREIAVDVASVGFDPRFPDLEAFPGDMGAIATLLSPDGVRLDVELPGGETRTEQTSGQDLVMAYALLADGRSAPWPPGGGRAETDGRQVAAPGDPPVVGTLPDVLQALGELVAALFEALEDAGLDPVHAVGAYLGPRSGLDVESVYEDVCGSP